MPVSDQGTLKDRYMLVPRTLIFVTRGAQVLLIRGAAHKRLWANRYNGLGGHVERGEDVLSAARRELREETGLEADLRLCGVITIDTQPQTGIGLYVFSGECIHGEPVPSDEGTPEWIDPRDLPILPTVEDLPVLLTRVLAMRPGDAPFSAHTWYDPDGRMVIRFNA